MEKKTCCICKEELEIDNFSTRTDRKNLQYQSSCKKCHKEYRKTHYINNKKKYISKAKTYNKKIEEWFIDLKSKLICECCGESRYWVLDFHHTNPSKKEGNLGVMMRRGSKANILKEMAKCKVLCSNCHRDLHHKEKIAAKVLMNTQESSKLQ